MGKGCRENREASGWERSSYDVTPTFSWRYNVSPFVLDSPLLFFSFPFLCLFLSFPLFPYLSGTSSNHWVRPFFCAFPPWRFSLRSAARDDASSTLSNTDFTTCFTSSIYIIKLPCLKLINCEQYHWRYEKENAIWCVSQYTKFITINFLRQHCWNLCLFFFFFWQFNIRCSCFRCLNRDWNRVEQLCVVKLANPFVFWREFASLPIGGCKSLLPENHVTSLFAFERREKKVPRFLIRQAR